MKVAVVGATGMVGNVMLQVLAETKQPAMVWLSLRISMPGLYHTGPEWVESEWITIKLNMMLDQRLIILFMEYQIQIMKLDLMT